MALKAYHIAPIDWGWMYLPTVYEFGKRFALAVVDVSLGYQLAPAISLDKFFQDFQEAQQLAKQSGWEGDFSEQPRVFFIPIESEIKYGFVWKQSNNGSTFVVAPVSLPWLNSLL